MSALVDQYNRPLHDLRISVTDRCNFRCTYCMPAEIFGEAYQFTPQPQLLTFEEITRLTRILSDVHPLKIRLTGGEPLIRRELPQLIEQLAGLDGAYQSMELIYDSLIQPIADVLHRAQERGEVQHHNLELLAGSFLAMVQGLHAIPPFAIQTSLQDMSEDLVAVLLNGIRP